MDANAGWIPTDTLVACDGQTTTSHDDSEPVVRTAAYSESALRCGQPLVVSISWTGSMAMMSAMSS